MLGDRYQLRWTVCERASRVKLRRPPSKREVRDSLRALSAAAPDRERAAAGDAALGLDRQERARAKPAPQRPDAGAREAQVLNAVLHYLRLLHDVGWVQRMNVGAFEADDRYLRFGWAGASDIIGQMRDGRFLAIECKRERGGKVTEAQQAFIDKVRRFGGVAGVVCSVDEAALLIRFAMMR